MKKIVFVTMMVIGLLNISSLQHPNQAIDKNESIAYIQRVATDPGSG
ncbi:hypothetical protein ACT7C1_26265 [Bacillus paranthracis]|nr:MULTISPECIES: hypothetical protein [Bacillus cereus group]